MSGSGGGGSSDYNPRASVKTGGGGGGGAGGGAVGDPCAIDEIAVLNSPNPTVVRGLRAGDVLAVVFQAGPPQLLLARTSHGATAGSITSPSQLQIIDCINNRGARYEAHVVAVRGAVVQVRILKV
mgnify:CR=1 FL=1